MSNKEKIEIIVVEPTPGIGKLGMSCILHPIDNINRGVVIVGAGKNEVIQKEDIFSRPSIPIFNIDTTDIQIKMNRRERREQERKNNKRK